MEFVDRVIQLGNVERKELEQICFKCPALLRDDLKELAKHYQMTVTSLIINSLTVLVQDFKGGDISSLTIHQSRACLKIEELEEKLEPYLADNETDGFEYRGYLLSLKNAGEHQNKVDNIINRIENLKKVMEVE